MGRTGMDVERLGSHIGSIWIGMETIWIRKVLR